MIPGLCKPCFYLRMIRIIRMIRAEHFADVELKPFHLETAGGKNKWKVNHPETIWERQDIEAISPGNHAW